LAAPSPGPTPGRTAADTKRISSSFDRVHPRQPGIQQARVHMAPACDDNNSTLNRVLFCVSSFLCLVLFSGVPGDEPSCFPSSETSTCKQRIRSFFFLNVERDSFVSFDKIEAPRQLTKTATLQVGTAIFVSRNNLFVHQTDVCFVNLARHISVNPNVIGCN
jgi:hypothetical protein